MVCQYCGRASSSCADDPDGEAWQIDHIVPLARGGSHRRSNWTLSCRACNAAKKAKLLEEWQPTQASEQA